MSYLNRLFEIFAAKRTPEQIAEDKRLLKEKQTEYEEKVKKRREKEDREDPKAKEPKSDKPKPKETAEESLKRAAEKIKMMKAPYLVFVRSDITSTEDEKTKDVLDKAKDNYQSFLKGLDENGEVNSEIKAALDASYNLLNIEDEMHLHVWVSDYDHARELTNASFLHGIEIGMSPIPDIDKPKQMDKIQIDFKGITDANQSSIRLKLKEAWKPLEEILAKKKDVKKEPEKKKEPVKEEEEKVEPPKESADETAQPDDEKEEETKPEESELPLTDDDTSEHHINVGYLRSMSEPYILLLDPRKNNADFQKFVQSGEHGASKILPKAKKSLFLKSRKLKSNEGDGVRIYFFTGKDAQAVQQELKSSQVEYKLGQFSEDLFEQEDPFTDLKIQNTAIDKTLTDEMNNLWVDATAAAGNPIPAVQINSSISLDYFRFLNKQQRPIEVYIGGIPQGAGYTNTVYVLASEQEANTFIKTLKKFRLPSLFYDRLSSNSDIDNEFKKAEPEKFKPSNVLILKSDKFNPKEAVKITDANKYLVEDMIKQTKPIQDKIKKLTEQLGKEKSKLTDLSSKPDSDTKDISDSIKNLTEEINNLKSDLDKQKVTQLSILHAFAKEVLKNKQRNVGSFIRDKRIIGTHVVHFNADLTICFVWGSTNQHIKLEPKEVMTQLPFVSDVITSYL